MKYLQQRIVPPFRAEVSGKFVKPGSLISARAQFDSRSINSDMLESVENTEIYRHVGILYDMGFDVATDGGLRNDCGYMDFFSGFNGVSPELSLSGKISFNDKHPYLRYFNYLQAVAPLGMTARVTIPAPSRLYVELVRGGSADTLYPVHDDLLRDISAAYHRTLIALYEIGCRNVLVDGWTFCADESPNECMRLNEVALNDLPADFIVSVNVGHGACGAAFAVERVDAYYIDFDVSNPDELAILEHVPDRAMAVLGIVSPRCASQDSKEIIADYIRHATRYVPIDRLCLGTACDMADCASETEQWNMLKLVHEISEMIW